VFIEAGSGPQKQRWSRPDAIRTPAEPSAASETAARTAT
jgi:hypothetical protein